MDICPKSCHHTVYTPHISYAAISGQSINRLLSGQTGKLSKALSKSLDMNSRINSVQLLDDIRSVERVTSVLDEVGHFIENTILMSSDYSVYKIVIDTLQEATYDIELDIRNVDHFLRGDFDLYFDDLFDSAKTFYFEVYNALAAVNPNAVNKEQLYQYILRLHYFENRFSTLGKIPPTIDLKSRFLVQSANLIYKKCLQYNRLITHLRSLRSTGFPSAKMDSLRYALYANRLILDCYKKYFQGINRVEVYRKGPFQIHDPNVIVSVTTKTLENLYQKFLHIKDLKNSMSQFRDYLVTGKISKSKLIKRFSKDDLTKVIDFIDSFTFDLKIQLNPSFLKWLANWELVTIQSQISLLAMFEDLLSMDSTFNSHQTLQFIQGFNMWKRQMIFQEGPGTRYELRSTESGNDVFVINGQLFKNNMSYKDAITEHAQVMHESYIKIFRTLESDLDSLNTKLSSAVGKTLKMIDRYNDRQELNDVLFRFVYRRLYRFI